MRTLIIGDIHGCYDELISLIKLFSPKKGDKIYTVGDIIGKGPSVKKVIETLIELKIDSVLGNHEYWFLKKGKEYDPLSFLHKSPYIDYLKSMKPYLDKENFFLVHAGINPYKGIYKSDITEYTNIRNIDYGDGKTPWFKLYNGKKIIIFGHWAKQGLVNRSNVKGLDSGCVYGKSLTGYIVEEDSFISIKSKKCYSPIIPKPES
ncbi:MAG: metallophosphoesterase [Candidatus Cloacimonadota bacterium]|nr:MAG: metallophosphoesterase [Candidatus Cloacimonadota bacterium]PIE77942.1 MAG: metallophosphoesterase [Candidatus Delongbacteria bacterium]